MAVGTKQSIFQPGPDGKHSQVKPAFGMTISHAGGDRTHEHLAHQDQGLGRKGGQPKAYGVVATHPASHRSTIGDAGIKTETLTSIPDASNPLASDPTKQGDKPFLGQHVPVSPGMRSRCCDGQSMDDKRAIGNQIRAEATRNR
jgi:hypothetical protein